MMSEPEEDNRPRVKSPLVILGKGNEITLYESILMNGQYQQYLSYNYVTKNFNYCSFVDVGDRVYLPLSKTETPYKGYNFSKTELEQLKTKGTEINFVKMYELVYNEFDRFLDIEDKYKHLECAFLFETYQQHKISSTGYLYHIGEHDSGKTRPLELQSFLAYRPLFGLKLNEANVYEVIGERYEGSCTILEDEAQELSDPKGHNEGKLAIYRGGYKRGQSVPRIMEGSSAKRHTRYYKTFCCKSFSGYYMSPKDHAFNSRCLPIPYVEGHPKKDEIEEEDIELWTEMKKQLLLWRLKTCGEKLPKLETNINNRIKEIWKSKIQVASFYDKAYTEITSMALEAQKRRFKNLHNSLESHITRTVIKLEQKNNWGEIRFADIWNEVLLSLEVYNTEDFTKKKVYVDALGYELSKSRVGTKLGSSLHGEPNFRHGKGRVWKFEKDKMKRLAQRFGLKREDCE